MGSAKAHRAKLVTLADESARRTRIAELPRHNAPDTAAMDARRSSETAQRPRREVRSVAMKQRLDSRFMGSMISARAVPATANYTPSADVTQSVFLRACTDT